MDNKELTARLQKRLSLKKGEAARLIAATAAVISEQALMMNSISIYGFGTFEPRKKLERINVNPATAKRILIPPKLTLSFKPSINIKNKLKTNPGHEQ